MVRSPPSRCRRSWSAPRCWYRGRSRCAPLLRRLAEPRRRCRIADGARQAQRAERSGSSGSTTRPFTPSLKQFGHAGNRRRDAAEPLARRLDQHIGQSVAVAVARRCGRRARRDRALRYRASTSSCACAPCHSIRVGEPERFALRLELRQKLAAADMDEAPGQIFGQQRQRLEQHVIALLLDRAADAQEDRPDRLDRSRRAAARVPVKRPKRLRSSP